MLAASDKKPEFFIFSETPSAKEKIGQSRTFMVCYPIATSLVNHVSIHIVFESVKISGNDNR